MLGSNERVEHRAGYGVNGKGRNRRLTGKETSRRGFRSGFIFSFVVMDTHVAFACS